MTVDPVTLSVIASGLEQVCDEMDIAIEQAAFCPVVSEARDRASGIYSAIDGEMVSQGQTGLPIFVGNMQFCVQACMAAVPDLCDGDIIVTNDPYSTGTHLMDVKLVAPYFYEGELVAFLADTAHWSDIGGGSAGGFNATARSVHEEGLRIPPIALYCGGAVQQGVLDLIMGNVRVADERLGDLKAQLAAMTVGRRRLDALFDRHGAAAMVEAFSVLGDRSQAQMESFIAMIPDGVYRSESFMDDDGISFDPLRVALAIRVQGSKLTADFEGSSPTTAGPFNSAYVSTASAVYLAMKHLFPEGRMSGGAFRSLDVRVPEGSFLNGQYPSAVSGCSSEVTMRIVDTVFAALAPVLPDRITAACFGSICCFTVAGTDPASGREYVLFSFSGGGYGANAGGDGLTNGCAPISIARTTPLEIVESQYPVIFDRYGLHEGSAGAGKYRGGYGVDVKLRLLRGGASVNVLADRQRFTPTGEMGGQDAQGTVVEFEMADGRPIEIPHGTKISGVRMEPGDLLHVSSPGGGGYGDPAERDPDAVLKDLEEQRITPEEAATVYGRAWAKATRMRPTPMKPGSQ